MIPRHILWEGDLKRRLSIYSNLKSKTKYCRPCATTLFKTDYKYYGIVRLWLGLTDSDFYFFVNRSMKLYGCKTSDTPENSNFKLEPLCGNCPKEPRDWHRGLDKISQMYGECHFLFKLCLHCNRRMMANDDDKLCIECEAKSRDKKS